jgi:hypothetical protein
VPRDIRIREAASQYRATVQADKRRVGREVGEELGEESILETVEQAAV